MRYSSWNSVTEYLVKNLENKIKNDGYKVGDQFLTENAICQQYNVGRSSVREALRVLSATGYIKSIRGKGTFISRIEDSSDVALKEVHETDSKQLGKLVEVRLLIEPASILKLVHIITPEQIEELEKIYSKSMIAVEQKQLVDVIMLDEKFHVRLIDFLENEYLSMINLQIQKKMSDFRAKTYRVKDLFALSQIGHRKILDALKNHNVDQVGEQMIKHINKVKEYYRDSE